MSSAPKCKFYSLGQCAKGSKCPFVHDDSGVCLYYQTGDCRFGSKCALKHIKLKKKTATKAVAPSKPIMKLQDFQPITKEILPQVKYSDMAKTNAISNLSVEEPKNTVAQNLPVMPKDPFVPVQDRIPLCPFKDYCRYGSDCKYKHGLECNICGQKVLHPQASIEEYQDHFSQCQKLKEKVESLNDSDMECVVCMELVRNKKDARFGLLTCEHCVCLECIREWRSKESVSTSKTCPICRSVTYFITPSTVWPDSEISKSFIISNYQSKLAKINCRHFNFGNGSCPFGTSCLYKHATIDGSLESSNLRYVTGGEEESRILPTYHLSDYL